MRQQDLFIAGLSETGEDLLDFPHFFTLVTFEVSARDLEPERLRPFAPRSAGVICEY